MSKQTTEKIGKRAAAAQDPKSIARVQAAREAFAKLTEMGQRGEVKMVHAIRYTVAKYPLLRREAVALMAGEFGCHPSTVNTQFQATRSGSVPVPKIILH